MAADHFQETAGDSDADARVRIQEIIEDLNRKWYSVWFHNGFFLNRNGL